MNFEQIKKAAFEDEFEKLSSKKKKKKKHPVSEAQRRWAFYAEEHGDLPEGKAMKWSKRAKGKDLPKHANLDQIQHAAFKDELEKIAIKNQVAAYGIRGATVGAGISSLGAAGLAMKLLKKVDPIKYPKSPLVAAAAIAGAIAGARVGGGMGAYAGGGIKGTHNLMDV